MENINLEYIQLFLVPACVGIVQAIKMTKKINVDYMPLVSILIGVTLGMFFNMGNGLKTGALIGILLGLAGSGSYDFVVRTVLPNRK